MQLKLKSNVVKELHIVDLDPESEKKKKVIFDYETIENKENNQEFAVLFHFNLFSDKGFEFKLKHAFIFECDEPISEKFWLGNFHSVNAPAIAYPYLRAFVSTVLLNAGLESVSLPSVNFVEMDKSRKAKEKKKK